MQWEFWAFVLAIALIIVLFVLFVRLEYRLQSEKKTCEERLKRLEKENPEAYLKELRIYYFLYPEENRPQRLNLNLWKGLYAFLIIGTLLGGASGRNPRLPH